jgi:hypothetical protein
VLADLHLIERLVCARLLLRLASALLLLLLLLEEL